MSDLPGHRHHHNHPHKIRGTRLLTLPTSRHIPRYKMSPPSTSVGFVGVNRYFNPTAKVRGSRHRVRGIKYSWWTGEPIRPARKQGGLPGTSRTGSSPRSAFTRPQDVGQVRGWKGRPKWAKKVPHATEGKRWSDMASQAGPEVASTWIHRPSLPMEMLHRTQVTPCRDQGYRMGTAQDLSSRRRLSGCRRRGDRSCQPAPAGSVL